MKHLKFSLLLIFLFVLSYAELHAGDLEIKNIRFVNRQNLGLQPHVLFDLSWKNAWKNDKNHDAVWIFTKFNNNPWAHPKIDTDGHAIIKNRIAGCPDPVIKASKDSMGLWIYVDEAYRGDINVKVKINLDTSNQQIKWPMPRDFKVYGLEMVYIPAGPFFVGDPSPASENYASLFESDTAGNRKGAFYIDSEEEIIIGKGNSNLYYWSEEEIYNGDQKGPIPAAYPKGTNAFYLMKYELSQGNYADFLTQLPDNWSYLLSPIGGKNYYKKKGSIYQKNGKYFAKANQRPMNYISFTDGLAYSDWAGLRPITELEYEKAARGPSSPHSGYFVWGTDNYNRLERYVDVDGQVINGNGYNEKDLTDDNRDIFGASYYWVMDLSGSLWEKVITIGNPIGRSFKGTHGDGLLEFGKATNKDWPQSNDEEGGFGYRGGGYYDIGTEYSDYNPHSPTGYRYYGAWSGGPRYTAYGYRAGRSAD